MASQALIEIQELERTFQTKNGTVHTLKNINLQIQQRDIFGVIGVSGAGKSTLVRYMSLLERPIVGRVLFDGKDIAKLNDLQLRMVRRSMGMIFQQFNLLVQCTAESNICFPLEVTRVDKKTVEARVKELLELVGLSDRAKSRPSQLSDGRKQHVVIARTLTPNSRVLLYDEATSALDPTTTASILSSLKDINRRLGIAIIIITHEMSVIEQICNQITIIDKSHVVEVGSVGEIFFRPEAAVAQKLVYPDDRKSGPFSAQDAGATCYRIVFDGSSSFEPVIADMVLEFKVPVNIIYTDMKNTDGRAFGQIVIQVPQQESLRENMLRYPQRRGLTVKEVNGYVG